MNIANMSDGQKNEYLGRLRNERNTIIDRISNDQDYLESPEGRRLSDREYNNIRADIDADRKDLASIDEAIITIVDYFENTTKRGFNRPIMDNNRTPYRSNGYGRATSRLSASLTNTTALTGRTRGVNQDQIDRVRPADSRLMEKLSNVDSANVATNKLPYFPLTDRDMTVTIDNSGYVHTPNNVAKIILGKLVKNPVSVDELDADVVNHMILSNTIKVSTVRSNHELVSFMNNITDDNMDLEKRFDLINSTLKIDKMMAGTLATFLARLVKRNGIFDEGMWVYNNLEQPPFTGLISVMRGTNEVPGFFATAATEQDKSLRSDKLRLIANIGKRLKGLDYEVVGEELLLSDRRHVFCIAGFSELMTTRGDYDGHQICSLVLENYPEMHTLFENISQYVLELAFKDGVKDYSKLFWIVDTIDPHGRKWKVTTLPGQYLLSVE